MWKARRLGYQVFVDTSVCPGHVGEYPYGVQDYLCYQDAVLAAGGLASYRMEQRKKSAEWIEAPKELEEVAP